MAQGHYAQTIDYIEQWEAINTGTVPPKNHVLKSQALYQEKRYPEAASYIEVAIEGHEQNGYLPDENWLILQRAIYFEMQDAEKVKQIIAKLIRLYDAPKYWIQLAGMYGELEEDDKQLATMEIAYQRGFITSASDTFNLAQLYFYHGMPYKGAALMEQAIEAGQLDANLRNLTFLGHAWQRAQEDKKAVSVMRQAVRLTDEGELDAQLALLLYNTDDFEQAIAVGKQAIEKGGLNRTGDTHVVIGLSLYNLGEYATALEELGKAKAFSTSKSTASQWTRFVQNEQRTAIALQGFNAAP
jgi:tetratricopeptide (TPR) repeat protein